MLTIITALENFIIPYSILPPDINSGYNYNVGYSTSCKASIVPWLASWLTGIASQSQSWFRLIDG